MEGAEHLGDLPVVDVADAALEVRRPRDEVRRGQGGARPGAC